MLLLQYSLSCYYCCVDAAYIWSQSVVVIFGLAAHGVVFRAPPEKHQTARFNTALYINMCLILNASYLYPRRECNPK